MRNRETKQQVLRDWLISHPGHLKTSYAKLADRFSLSYEDVRDIIKEVKDYFKRGELLDRGSSNYNNFISSNRKVVKVRLDSNTPIPVVKFKTGNAQEDRELNLQLLNQLLQMGVFDEQNDSIKVDLQEEKIEPFLTGDKNNVLVIGDTHIPFERKGYLKFCREVQERFNCGTVVHIGDVVDNNYSSYHETNPDGHSAGDELALAISKLKSWYYTFPEAYVCLGNHDQIIQRKAFTSGMSKRWIKGLAEVLEVPNWKFDLEHQIQGVIYTHGTGTSGDRAAFNRALNRRLSVVSGHLHTTASITWNVSEIDRIFAMQVGCGIDDAQYSFDYAKAFSKKSIVSCGVVLNGKLPIVVPMEL